MAVVPDAADRVAPREGGEGTIVVVIPTLDEEAVDRRGGAQHPARRSCAASSWPTAAAAMRRWRAPRRPAPTSSPPDAATAGPAWTATMAAEEADIVVFMDGDGADDPRGIAALVEPIRSGRCDFVIGSRARGKREPGSIAWHQIAAGRVAGLGMRLLYGVRYTDMCAFRAIRRDVLLGLGMREETYGWNIEMQMRAARAGLRILEVPVDYHRRSGGSSKVAGSLRGTLRAGTRIVATFVRVAMQRAPREPLTDGCAKGYARPDQLRVAAS